MRPQSLDNASTSYDNPRCSSRGVFRVHQYGPHDGVCGASIKATVECVISRDAVHNPLAFRLVIGQNAVRTEIIRIPNSSRWFEIKGKVPVVESAGQISTTLGLILQVIDGRGEMIDSAPFGHFNYWDDAAIPHLTVTRTPSQPYQAPRDETSKLRESSAVSQSMAGSRTRRHAETRQLESLNSNRLSILQISPDSPRPTVFIDEPHGINNLSQDWTDTEIFLGRRLVEFTFLRKESEKMVDVAYKTITQGEYTSGTVVISCIRRPSAGTYHVTSVDVLYLIENIIGTDFTVEEKNRLRRNVECYKPLTIYKAKAGTDLFFQQIVKYPFPRPRNLIKDIKVFSWEFLYSALVKVLSKYAIVNQEPRSEPFTPRKPDTPTTQLSTLNLNTGPLSTQHLNPFLDPKCESSSSDTLLPSGGISAVAATQSYSRPTLLSAHTTILKEENPPPPAFLSPQLPVNPFTSIFDPPPTMEDRPGLFQNPTFENFLDHMEEDYNPFENESFRP